MQPDEVVVSVLTSDQMNMVQVSNLVLMLVDVDIFISHLFGLRRSFLSSVRLLAISSGLAN